MQIQQINIHEIKPYWRNPRNNESAVDAVMESIKNYGFNSPLVLDKENIIITGHTRYKALLQLGWDKVPCVILDIEPIKAKAYRIADNKTSEFAIWDMDKLIPELRELDTDNFQIYFPDVNLENLLGETGGAINYEDPTQENIEDAKEQLEDKFSEANNSVGYVEIICPHCEELHYLSKSDIQGLPTVEKQGE